MPPPVVTQERRSINPRFSALQKPWVVAPQINNPNHDTPTVQFSRRDFLKASGIALGGLALAAMSSQTAHALDEGQPQQKEPFVYSMRERLSTASQEFLQNHNIRTICYEGRTLSIDDPAIADDRSLANHFDSIVNQLRSVELSGQKPKNVAGYKGDETPPDVSLNFNRVTFSISKTEDQKLITQTVIGKVGDNGFAEVEPWNWFELRKSLMVTKEGKEDKPAWFDNVRSGGFMSGKNTQILVNPSIGTVFQLTTDSQNALQTVFSGLRGAVSVERLKEDMSSMELSFLPTAPAFLHILNGLKDIFTNRGIFGQVQTRLDEFYEQVFSPRAKPETRRAFFESIGISNTEFKDAGLGVMDTLYATDFPTTMDMSLQLMGAYGFILNLIQNPTSAQAYLKEAKDKGSLFSSLIPADPIPTAADEPGQKLREVTNSILQREILLPHSIPQLHIVQMRNNFDPSLVKQVLVARYAANDTSTLNSFATTVIPGENIEYITDVNGSTPMDIFGYGFFNQYDRDKLELKMRTISNRQYVNVDPTSYSPDANQKLAGWSADPNAQVVEIRKEHVRLYYDPAANQSRLFAGVELPQRNGTGKIVELRPGSMKGRNYTERKTSSNRTVWFTGDYPYSIMDVTDKVVDLRKKGFTTASQFGFLSPPEAAEMVYGLAETNINYAKVESFLGEQKNAMIQYGNPGGPFDSAHSILIAHKASKVTRYTMEEKGGILGLFTTKEYVPSGSETVERNMLLRAYELITIKGKQMVVVAKNRDDGTIYAVPEADMQFVGVDSDMLLDLQKAIIAAAVIFGGYKIYSIPGVSNALNTLTRSLVKAVFSPK